MTDISAIEDYNRARWRATVEQLYARFVTGRSTDLLSYEEVRQRVRAREQVSRGLQDIPLDSVVGSVGRYRDFTRSFLPKDSTSQHRWANVKAINASGSGLPPIDVYKIGDVYFVSDGNHRVSVARENGAATIQAYVTEVMTAVPITPDMQPDDLIIAEQYADFIEKTGIDDLVPQADLRVTVPSKYPLLLEHIEVHRYFMGLDYDRDITKDEAVVHWYEKVYQPVINQIRQRGILHDFPERTETDLYIWLAENRADLESELGWELSTEDAVEALADQNQSILTRFSSYLYETITGQPTEIVSQLPEVTIESELVDPDHYPTALFREILIALRESSTMATTLEQGFQLGEKESALVRVMSIAKTEESRAAVIEQFDDASSRHTELPRRLAFYEGTWDTTAVNRARWNDLLVVGLPANESGSDLNYLPDSLLEVLHYVPRPILAVPRVMSSFTKALIAYDGSRRARQALFVGAYMATHWGIPLVVLSVGEPSVTRPILDEAKAIFDRYDSLDVEYLGSAGPITANIFITLESHGCDFLIMGGYPRNRLVELFVGSTGDQVLRNTALPVFICQ